MFKASRWRGEKNKIKAAFKFQFQASEVPQLGWETMMVTLIPVDVGRPSTRSDKVAVVDGSCRWTKPVFETVKLTHDPKSGKINERVYQFIVSATGSTKAGLLGEATLNLADYVEVLKPCSVALPLRPTTIGAVLHVTLQRVHGEIDGRETDENGDSIRQRRTLMSQLSNTDKDENPKITNGRIDDSATDGRTANNQADARDNSSRTLPLRTRSDITLSKSSSSDTISVLGSDSSSGRYTPKENDFRDGRGPNTDWLMSSVLGGSVGGSTNSSGENGWRERLYDPDMTLEKLRTDAIALARQVELSSLELQTLRKQVVKESRRGQELLKELTNVKEDRDATKKEFDELKQNIFASDATSRKSKFEDEDPQSILEEMKEELNHEKNINGNLRLQLQKTQEANSELILAVRDLEELLERRTKKISSCSGTTVITEPDKDVQVEEDTHLCELPAIQPENETEQYDLEELVKEHVPVTVGYSVEKQLIDLKSEMEFYRKDREELEMQMEQLALDYEILKQENHDISTKLEQTQLREQLRMQYECSAHLAIINDLENQVENLENELAKQAVAFEADIKNMVCEKVQQEQRAIHAEEALRISRRKNANTAEHLQEEFTRLSAQMSSTFYANEKIAMQAITEASELRFENCRLQELLDEANEALSSSQSQFHTNVQELLHLLDEKKGEIDKLKLEISNKHEELENLKKSEERRQKDMEEILKEKESLFQQLKDRNVLQCELENLRKTAEEIENLLEERNLEKDLLETQVVSMHDDAAKLHEQLGVLKRIEEDKEAAIKLLISEKETLQLQNHELEESLLRHEMKQENLKSNPRSNQEKFPVQGNNVEDVQNEEENIQLKDCLCISQSSKSNHCFEPVKRENVFDATDNKGMSSLPRIGVSKCYVNGTCKNQIISCEDAFDKEGEILSPCSSGQHGTVELSSDMALLKERNKCMEAELKELQDRYSEISLKFAEVEGERQQLVMTIRTLKNSMKN